MAHHRDAGVRQRLHERRHLPPALKLDHLCACDPQRRCVPQRVRLLQVRPERHVSHDHRLRARVVGRDVHQRGVDAAPHRDGRAQHVVHGHPHRVRQAQPAVPQAVAHEHELQARAAREARGGEVVGRHHGELLAAREFPADPRKPKRARGPRRGRGLASAARVRRAARGRAVGVPEIRFAAPALAAAWAARPLRLGEPR
mmetsp:Transcript_107453/g.304477  ORF Transcript_107453/g.304477 Transcript_107453/m.304477 type:complete len:200 (-) Transcript_107453:308-907(-)